MFWWIAATVCAYLVKGMCGFADTLVFTGIISFTQETSVIVPLTVILAYPANLIVMLKNRRLIRWKQCLPVIVPMLIGEIPGAWLLASVHSAWLKVALGILITLLGIRMLTAKPERQKPLSGIMAWCAGIMSGLICGLFGIGVPIAASVSCIFSDPQETKTNIAFVFFFDTTFRMIMYAVNGIVTLPLLRMAAWLLPVMLISVIIGMKLSERMNVAAAKRLIQLMLIISGISLTVMNLQW